MSKKTLSKIIFIIFVFGLSSKSFAADDADFNLYKTRQETICSTYKPKDNKSSGTDSSQSNKSDALLLKNTEYTNPYKDNKTAENIDEISKENFLEQWKKIYKTNMNNMYKCALLKIQITELRNVKKLINVDKTWELGKNIAWKIDWKINKLKSLANNWWDEWSCKNINTNKEFSKKEVLDNTTYETCKYISYLDFLRNYYTKVSNLTNKNIESKIENKESQISTISWLAKEFNSIQREINMEESHTIDVFPIALASYNEYAYNYPLHVLLVLIKEDLIIFRDKLHATINPINQVVYKISNAMSKD